MVWETAPRRSDAVRAEPRTGRLSMSALVFDVHSAVPPVGQNRPVVNTEGEVRDRGRDRTVTLKRQTAHTQAAVAA